MLGNRMQEQRQLQEVFSKGSLSFYFAAQFFSKTLRDDFAVLYAWCRLGDDTADQALAIEEKKHNLNQFRAQTIAAHQKIAWDSPLFHRFSVLVKKYEIPVEYFLDLIEGLEWDLDFEQPQTETELLRYCYHVAGVVGILSCFLFGIRSQEALNDARNLGIAMQLTNIVRDVETDAKMNRVYLPLDLMQATQSRIDAASHLQRLSEQYYNLGLKGTRFLHPKVSLVIWTAAEIYRAIGKRFVARSEHPNPWQPRIQTRWLEKFALFWKCRKAYRSTGKLQENKTFYRCPPLPYFAELKKNLSIG